MNEPKLRFKADDGSQFPDWEEKKIGDITLSHNAGVYIAKDNYGTGTNIIGVGDIYESDVINGKQYRLAPVDSDEYILDEGDLVYGESSLVPEGIARTVCISAAGKGTAFAWHTRRYKVDRTIINPYFLTLQVNYAKRVRNHLMRVCTRNALTGMTTNEYFGTKVSVPCLPEQQKIADFLSTIDTVIEKQKETVATWEERKKGVMQKLFSQEVRFKADDGSEFPEWEEKKLGDISERILVGLATTVTPYYREKGRPMFRNLNIKQGYLDDRDMLFLDDDYADSQKNKAIHFGDILTVHTGNIGWSCLVPEKYEGALSFTTLITTVKFNVVSNKYVCDFLNSPLGMNRMQNLAFSGGRANLNTSEFQKVQVPVPCLAEQQKIADCLSSLDEVIEKQKATLAAWEELKKGLLQQMFV